MDSDKQLDDGRKKLNVTITPDDQVLCRECGCGDFYQPIYIYKVQSPLIGAKPIVTIQPNTASFIMCAGCMSPLIPNTLTTKAELEITKEVVEGDTKLKKRANSEALRVMKTIFHASQELGVTPEEFAEIMDKEGEKLKLEMAEKHSSKGENV